MFIDSQDGPEDQVVFSTSHGQFYYALRIALQQFGLQDSGYSMHSLRHGRALHAFLNGISPHAVMMKGRWASEGTASATCRYREPSWSRRSCQKVLSDGTHPGSGRRKQTEKAKFMKF